MKVSPILKVILGVALLVFAGIIVSGIYHYRLNNQTGKSNLMLQHTNNVLYTSERVLSGLKDIETGTRGYVITGDSDFLQPYMISKDSVITNLESLKELVTEDIRQQPRVNALEKLTVQRLNIAKKVQDQRAKPGYDLKEVLPMISNGKKVMDEIRDSVKEIQAEEQQQLAVRKKQYESDRSDAQRSLIILIASVFLLIITLFLAARFFAMLRKNDTAAMFRQNAQLLFFRTRMDDIVKSISDPLFVVDKDLTIIYYNEAMQTGIAHGKGLLTGKNLYDALPQYNNSEMSRQVEKAQQTRTPAAFELHEDFLERWQDVTIYPTADGGLSVYLKDATARKSYEQRLHSAMEFLEETNRAAHIGGWELVVATGKISWTHMTHVIHELPPSYIPDLKNGILFYKEGHSRDTIAELVSNAISKKESWDVTLQIVTAAGNDKWVRSVGHPQVRDGEVIRVIGTFQDVDEQHTLGERLRDSEQRFRSAFDNSLDGMSLVASDGSVIEVNQSFCDIIGYNKDEFKKIGFKTITHPDDLAADEAMFKKIVSGQAKSWRYKKRYVAKNGSVIDAAVSGSVITDSNGKLTGFLAQMQKI